MQNVFQLTDAQFDQLLDETEVKSVKRKLTRQRKFELVVVERGWSFPENYSYVANDTKVSLICDNKETPHPREITPTKFMGRGDGCGACIGTCPAHAKDKFEREIESRGWSFAADYVYKTSKLKVSLVCNKGHPISMAPQVVMRGSKCKECGGKTPEQAKKKFETSVKKLGWKYADNYEYVNAMSHVSLVCNKGHPVTTTPSNFRTKKNPCRKCAGQCPVEAENKLLEVLAQKGWMTGPGYKYSGAHKKTEFLCEKGHPIVASPHGIKKRVRCDTCSGSSPEQAKTNFETSVERRGWKFASDYQYVNSTTKVALICSEHHRCEITPSKFKNDQGCATCSDSGFDPSVPAFLYVQSLSIGGAVSSYKFGITNLSPKIRMITQAKSSCYDHELIHVFHDKYGYKIQTLEAGLKQSIECSFVKRCDMPDGYTETVSPQALEELLQLIEKLKKKQQSLRGFDKNEHLR